ncbi:MAG: hypothetical protein E7010_04795 [Alphaproteobacteria bacterium]|nr:hypothetical protein [Alphaproteobacteria bacterium]
MIKKQKMHILPVFIFIAVLTLTIKVNNVFDLYNKQSQQALTISASEALAEEKINKETFELSAVLEKGQQAGNNSIKNPNNAFTQSEILILQELAERREALDLRAQEIDKRAIQLKVTEEEIEKKLSQLQDYEKRLNKLINEYSQKEKENIDSLVRLYSSMKPKDAARIFNSLDMNITVALLKGMKASVSSSILSQMESAKAQAVTSELIGNNL